MANKKQKVDNNNNNITSQGGDIKLEQESSGDSGDSQENDPVTFIYIYIHASICLL